MAVPCSQCGREYDVALFGFGRTISCTCGNRVGIAPRVLPFDEACGRRGRFAADAMLGRLARWLRLLGFDCTWDAAWSDAQLVHAALAEGRTILTRDRRLPEQWWVGDLYLVREQELAKQLAEVIAHFDLAGAIHVLTRCSACNRPLARVARADVSGRVPPRILAEHDHFAECSACGRVYWEGSHAARIRDAVDLLLAGAGATS